jgi:serine/alanine adding enzyme
MDKRICAFMTFKVLSSDNADWGRLVASLPLPLQDIHFLPEYGRIYEDVYGFKACMAAWLAADACIIQPFVLRPIHELDFIKGREAGEYYDLSHPYGYGGPLASSPEIAAAYQDFHDAFHKYCEMEGYASEFCSFHPLLIDQQKPMIEPVLKPYYQKEIFSVELAGQEDDLLAQFSQGHRRNYRKALNAGVTVERVRITPETLEKFRQIHQFTMQRHNAAERWWFPDDYFPACHRHLGDAGASIFFAYYNGELASACFLIHAFQTAYYHFGGSYDQFYDVRASNLLMTQAMIWAQTQGYKNFHLGGGVTSSEDDPLVKFKKGFGAKSYPLYSYEKVHSQKNYDFLSKMKMQYEELAGKQIVNKDYFPLYRR